MSIIIKGMKMPTSCLECRLFNDPWCMAKNRNQWRTAYNRPPKGERQNDCPLTPVPPHGRLVDADELRASIRESIDECHKWANEIEGGEMYARVSQSLGTFVECSLRIKAAPTIIEAEREE